MRLEYANRVVPKVGEPRSGDAVFARVSDGAALFVLLDGLGHGEPAYRVAERGMQILAELQRDARQTVQIMRLATADPELVSSTLTSLIPKVTVTATRPGSRRGQQDQQPQAGQPGGGPQPNAAMFQRPGQQQQRTNVQPGQGARGNFGGGGTGGGGGRQNFGGGTGGGGRPNTGGGGGRGGRGQ